MTPNDPPPDPAEAVPCEWIILRALRKSGWIDAENPTRVQGEAFFRRRPVEENGAIIKEGDSDGLSLMIASRCSIDECADTSNPCYGIASLHVGRLRNLGLKIVWDPLNDKKILISNLPYEPVDGERLTTENETLVGEVSNLARLVQRYKPPRKRSKPNPAK